MPSLHHRFRSIPGHWAVAVLCLSIALIGASALRLYRLDLIDFRFDQAYPLQFAIDITQGRLWAVQPYGSVAAHPPVYLYMMAIPYLFTRDFMTIVTVHALLDVLSVALCWVIGTRYFNWRVGSIAAILYAAGPWAVQNARNTWPVPQPMFAAIFIIGLLELVQRHNPWGWTISGLGLALSVGTHLAGIYLLPVALISWWLLRREAKWQPMVLGALPMMAIAIDYLLYDAAHSFENIRSLVSWLGKPARFSFSALNNAVWLSGGLHLSDLAGKAINQWKTQTPAWMQSIDTLQVAILILGIAITVISLLMRITSARRNDPPYKKHTLSLLIIVMWWILPIVVQLRHSQFVELQYMPITLPAPFLLMALGVDAIISLNLARWRTSPLLRWTKPVLAALAVGSLLVIVAWQVDTTFRFDAFVEAYDTSGGYGLPARSALSAVQKAIQARVSGITGDVAAVIKDYMTPWNEQGLTLHVMLADLPHRFLNSNVSGWVFDPGGTSYIFAPGTEGLLQDLYSFYKPSEVITSEVPLRDSLTVGYTYAQVQKLPDANQFIPATPAYWDNGLELMSYRINVSSTSIVVETLIHVLWNQPDGVDFHWYNNVFVGDKQVAKMDDSGIHPTAWRAGDDLLQRFVVPISTPLPAKGAYVRIGCYSYPQVHAVLVTQAGKLADDGVNLPITPS